MVPTYNFQQTEIFLYYLLPIISFSWKITEEETNVNKTFYIFLPW